MVDRRFVPMREVELRDQAVAALRGAIDHAVMGRQAAACLTLLDARPIIEELDQLHAVIGRAA